MAAKTPTLDMVNRKTGKRYPKIAAFWDDIDLASQFAGLTRDRINQTGSNVVDEPHLWDVSQVSPVHDKPTRNLIIGRMKQAKAAEVQATFTYWESLVPGWAPGVKDTLAAAGIPFSVELLASPEINLDGNPPLFPAGTAPVSLFGVTGNQRSELGFLRTLGADTLMLKVWPPTYRYYHRPAGAPVPADLVAGLMFGTPVSTPDGYIRSPLMSLPEYEAWNAAGQPA